MDFIKRLIGKIIHNNLIDFRENLISSNHYEQFNYDLANFVVFNQIEGDYLEFGVYNGDGLCSIYRRLKQQWQEYQNHAKIFKHEIDANFFDRKRFFAFDSFAGLPGSNQADTPHHFAQKGIYSIPIESFWNNLRTNRVNLENVIAVPGWFSETLTNELKNKYSLKQAALIFIDCDLSESAVSVFNFITNTIVDGTVMIIDDYFRYKGHPHKGIRGVLSEWLQENPSISLTEICRCAANRIAFVCHVESV
jgi:O-methyltransferase